MGLSFSSFRAVLSWKVKRGDYCWAWQAGVPLAFVLAMLLFYPTRTSFEMSYDEGIDLMKAMLVGRGYPLYSQIWSDQPPLFTYLLTGLFHLLGYKVGVGRILVLLFSAVLVWAAMQFLSLTWGGLHALFGAVLLFLLPVYPLLSITVMIGLPSLAFAVLSLLALALWHRRCTSVWLVLSALALSASLLVKLFTGILAPLFAAGILASQYYRLRGREGWRVVLMPALLWSLVFAVSGLGLGLLLVGPGNLGQLLEPNLASTGVAAFRQIDGAQPIGYYLRDSATILFLAVLGVVFTLRARRWSALYLVAWIGAAYLLLSVHVPVWYHHQLLITIPAAMLAAVAVGETLHLLPGLRVAGAWRSLNGLLCAATLAGVGLVLVARAPQALGEFDLRFPFQDHTVKETSSEGQILRKINILAPQTHWLVTDRPIYAFRAGLPVPPELAVFTSKRVSTGNLTAAQLLAVVKTYQPEQVLMGRFDFPQLDPYLADHYRLVRQQNEMKLYVRDDLPASP